MPKYQYLYLAYGEYPNGDYTHTCGTDEDGVVQLFKEQNPNAKLLGVSTYTYKFSVHTILSNYNA